MMGPSDLRRRTLAKAFFHILACLALMPTFTEPGAASPPAVSLRAQAGILVIAHDGGPERPMTAAELAGLPAIRVTMQADAAHGLPPQAFEGPLLWTVLERAGALEVTKVREQVLQIVRLTGRDGYSAVLAVGEIAPAFEGKQVIIADRMDGHPLDSEHLRIVVPGDKYRSRNVHDLARLVVTHPAA